MNMISQNTITTIATTTIATTTPAATTIATTTVTTTGHQCHCTTFSLLLKKANNGVLTLPLSTTMLQSTNINTEY